MTGIPSRIGYRSPHAVQTILAAGSSNTTSALQDGQANISNSSLSIMLHSFFSDGYSIY
jgi:hypothetical protein